MTPTGDSYAQSIGRVRALLGTLGGPHQAADGDISGPRELAGKSRNLGTNTEEDWEAEIVRGAGGGDGEESGGGNPPDVTDREGGTDTPSWDIRGGESTSLGGSTSSEYNSTTKLVCVFPGSRTRLLRLGVAPNYSVRKPSGANTYQGVWRIRLSPRK